MALQALVYQAVAQFAGRQDLIAHVLAHNRSSMANQCKQVFLLFQDSDVKLWEAVTRETRQTYADRRDHFLQFIQHPETLAQLSVDPLADDPDSPWNTVRQDELIRNEIQQDVQRLPDEANYHNERIQRIVLDVLFIYCKLHPERGGYRQGMHELLAPIVHVLEQDAIEHSTVKSTTLDELMLEVLDFTYIEHDAYILFAKLMEHAQEFYEIKEPNEGDVREQSSSIVERSRHIHEVCLHQIDPDLATHLKNIEILPQIFLIRWIRLLYNREFPFTQFLVLWDTIFATDPSLELVDLISCAMLLRIRWQLLEADYSVCLQLLLKYPVPDPTHGPHTFVDDAVFLKENLDVSGGSKLVSKYSDRTPAPPGSIKITLAGGRSAASPLRRQGTQPKISVPAATKFIQQQQGSVENFIQGAAKGAKDFLERGERLGINQAVRDAMGELKRNMQGFNESRGIPNVGKSSVADEAAKALALMESRNKHLASVLDETVANLKLVSSSRLEDKVKSLELIEIAAAKAQFVQIYLQDASMEVPQPTKIPVESREQSGSIIPAKSKNVKEAIPQKPLPPPPQVTDRKEAKVVKPSASVQPNSPAQTTEPSDLRLNSSAADGEAAANISSQVLPVVAGQKNETPELSPQVSAPAPAPAPAPVPTQTIPTRSTLAQSSFSWMLEPDEAVADSSSLGPNKSPTFQNRSRRANNASRDKNAFLFGEEEGELLDNGPLGSGSSTGQIFGLESIPKSNEN